MTSDVKKAAKHYVECKYRPERREWPSRAKDAENAFLAGDAHGFARAVKMLEDAGYVEHPKTGKCIAAREWAVWLEEQEKGQE